MSNYKIKCDNPKCNKTFISDNPEFCPFCKSEDFTLISKQKIRNKFLYIILILVGFSLIFYYSFFIDNVKSPVESDFKVFLNSYYEVLQNKEINKFDNFYSNNVNTWFNKKNISIEDVIISSNNYYVKYPFQIHDLNLDSLKIIKSNDHYFLTYDLFYAYRKNIDVDWNKLDIKKSMMLNSQMKIISIEESIKNNISINEYTKKYSGNFVEIYYKKIPLLTANQIYREKFKDKHNLQQTPNYGLYNDLAMDSLSKPFEDLLKRINEVLYEPHHFRYGKLNEALGYANQLIEYSTSSFKSDNFNFYTQRSKIHYLLGDYLGALEDINIAINLGNQFSDKWFYYIVPISEKAQINYMLNNYSDALYDLEVVIDYYLSTDEEFDKGSLIKNMLSKGLYLNAANNFTESCNVFKAIIEINEAFSDSQLEKIKKDYPNQFNDIKKVNYYIDSYCY